MTTLTDLILNAVSGGYGKVRVLQGVSLKVAAGEAVALLGRNGVGKTTTLKAIMGLIGVTGGSATFGDTDLSKIAPHRIADLGIGYVPQGRGIFSTLSVQENLEIGLTGAVPRDVEAYVYERFPRLKERRAQAGGTLSGGEQQQLAIARCLMMRPKIIILDEPTEGIMPILVAQIRDEIRAINDNGVSILLVEQNLKTALRTCGTIYVMEKGKVVHCSSRDALKTDKEVLTRYLGVSK